MRSARMLESHETSIHCSASLSTNVGKPGSPDFPLRPGSLYPQPPEDRMQIDREVLLALAPTELPNRRNDRFRGEGQDIAMADLHPNDRSGILEVYGRLNTLHLNWQQASGGELDPQLARDAIRLVEPGFWDTVTTLGRSTQPEASDQVKKVIHDIRGGALTAALLNAELLALHPEDSELLQTLVYLARDHAKMMRNAIRDVDPEGRRQDGEEKAHGMDDLIRKWHGQSYRVQDAVTKVQATTEFRGGLASCCLEAGAVDRILYNHLNNAARFATGDGVRIDVLDLDAGLLRFAVTNGVEPSQAAWLRERLTDDPHALYRTGVTRGGSGLGLANAAHFVASAFGLEDPSDALTRGYLGGRLIEDRYHAWFHWPAYA